ncbi:nitroreductase/quinone reductase family protein [Streptomyces sp. NPDC058171]
MPQSFNDQVIEEFRANNGRVGGPFAGARLILLTTTGRRSGRPHTTPVGYLPDGGERILVIASAGGAPQHPAWYHNLLAEPEVQVEDGVFVFRARAQELTGAERDEVFARAAEADPGWAEYQAKTDRVIPVVALVEVAAGPPVINSPSFADGLKVVHDGFRRELATIRAEIAAAGPELGSQLRMNCLTVCQGLKNHHQGEDQHLFPYPSTQHPELRAVMDRLEREHESIAELVEALRKLVAERDAEPTVLLAEFDRLTHELERHLTYEEEQLIPVLAAAGG